MRSCRQARSGLSPWTCQVPKSVASAILVAVPRGERVPPLIFRCVTRWRRLRSAALLSGGTAGSSHEDEELRQEALHPPAELALYGQRVVQEGATDSH